MGLFTYTLAGGGFILIGSWEALLSSLQTLKVTPPPPPPPPPPLSTKTTPSLSPITFTATSLLSFFFILDSLISLTNAVNSSDQMGIVLQLEVIAIASLFLLYSLLGIITHFKSSNLLPSEILNLLCLFGFVEEFMLFYLQRKDPTGIENRYFDLLLVPISICLVSTVLELRTPESNFPRLVRGVGLVLQGMWFIQMGFAFYSNLIAHGCSLHEKSRGNYTIKCKGHPEYHRASAIATLQFNCNLALLVALIAGAYSIVCRMNGGGSGFTHYRPLGSEMQQMDKHANFTLDSDDDDDVNEGRIQEERNVGMNKAIVVLPEQGDNGYDSNH